ncbi:MAG TPA: tetratricopeptide repeat protein [Candidatus Angelobacter sp.]|nr:tetratricopeptide repeat protein [Candidatus Angelobacter sp.]
MTLNRSVLALILLVPAGLAASAQQPAPPLDPQSSSYQAQRRQASELFEQGKRLEALPILERLVRSRPKDDQMLVALAACLVEHAATLTDQQAAAQERFRARDLLDQAWKLGNTSTLAQNLSHLLKELPASGALKFSDNPAVDQIMQAGEAAFARRDFDEAIRDYSHALELEPKNYSAALFIGNSYDRKGDYVNGRKLYQQAMALDPNVETAYRYCADMLARQGDMAGARAMLIHAAVAEPYNRIVWRELHAWATLNKTKINEIYIGQPAPKTTGSEPGGNSSSATQVSAAWQAYRSVQAEWRQGDAFRKYYPRETKYRHSLGEELQALTAAADTEEKQRQSARNGAAPAEDPSLTLLLRLHRAGLIEAYVLFSLGDEGIARDYAAYRGRNRAKLEAYMDQFVIPSL